MALGLTSRWWSMRVRAQAPRKKLAVCRPPGQHRRHRRRHRYQHGHLHLRAVWRIIPHQRPALRLHRAKVPRCSGSSLLQGAFLLTQAGAVPVDGSDRACDDLNLYAYVGNNPVNFTDLSGLIGPVGAALGAATNIGLQLVESRGVVGEIKVGEVVIAGATG